MRGYTPDRNHMPALDVTRHLPTAPTAKDMRRVTMDFPAQSATQPTCMQKASKSTWKMLIPTRPFPVCIVIRIFQARAV